MDTTNVVNKYINYLQHSYVSLKKKSIYDASTSIQIEFCLFSAGWSVQCVVGVPAACGVNDRHHITQVSLTTEHYLYPATIERTFMLEIITEQATV